MNMKESINIEDFAKIELRVGKILEAHLVEGADKLYRFLVDVGEMQTTTNDAGEQITKSAT
jgi:tRNA-binding EMAP/Myf-like protein